jgi:biotin carboxylase
LLRRKPEGVLIEKYIDAPQFSVELFDGKALNVKRSFAARGPFPIMIGHDAPASLPRERFEAIKNFASAIVREVGISSGPSSLQLRDSGTEKYLIEINPRPSMNGPVEIDVATGINLADLCLRFSCENPYENELLASCNKRACATRFVVRRGSSVRAIEGLGEARKIPGRKSIYVDESYFYRRGLATGARDRIAVVHSEADSIELAAANADTAIDKLIIVYDGFPIDWIKFYARRLYRLLHKALNHYRSLRYRGGKAGLSGA